MSKRHNLQCLCTCGSSILYLHYTLNINNEVNHLHTPGKGYQTVGKLKVLNIFHEICITNSGCNRNIVSAYSVSYLFQYTTSNMKEMAVYR